MSITDSQDSNFLDAGDMRSGGAVSSLDVNSCGTEASAVFDEQSTRGAQGSVVQVSLAEALSERFMCDHSTQCTTAVSGEGTSSEPRLPYSDYAPERLEAHRSYPAASSGSGGTDPPVQAIDPERQEELVTSIVVSIPELPSGRA